LGVTHGGESAEKKGSQGRQGIQEEKYQEFLCGQEEQGRTRVTQGVELLYLKRCSRDVPESCQEIGPTTRMRQKYRYA